MQSLRGRAVVLAVAPPLLRREHQELRPGPARAERALPGRALAAIREREAPRTRRRLARFKIEILAQPAFDQAAVFGEADLPADVQQAIGLDRGNITRHRGGSFGKGDAEFGKALFDAHGVSAKHRKRAGVKPHPSLRAKRSNPFLDCRIGFAFSQCR